MNQGLSKAVTFLRNPLVLFVIVNAPFLFIFYDVWNLSTTVYASSYLAIGLNPYWYGSQITAGLPIQFLGLVTFFLFHSLQSNFLATAAVLKLIFLALTYCCGLVLSRVAKIEGLSYHRKLLYAFIFNPFVLFVNNVWVETDIIVIFLYVLGYVAIHYGWERAGETRYLVLGALCIGLAIFSYYSVVLLVPTLVLYRNTLRKKVQVLVAFLAMAALLSIPLWAFGLTSLEALAGHFQSSSPQITYSSVFNLIAPIPATALTHLVLAMLVATFVASVVVPIVLKRYGATEAVSLLTSFCMAYLLFVNTVQGDNFVLLIGLLMLALISLGSATLSYRRIFALQLFLLPQFVVVEMFNGINGVLGVCYWSYYQFHATVNLYQYLGGRIVWHVLLGVYLVSLCVTLGLFLRPQTLAVRGSATHASSSSRPVGPPRPAARINRVVSAILLGTLLILAVGIPATVTLEPSIGRQSSAITGFDAGLFLPQAFGSGCTPAPTCAYRLSSSDTYQENGPASSVQFATNSPPIGLWRNMTDQSFGLDVTANVSWENDSQSLESMELVNASSFYAGLGTAVVVNNTSLVRPVEVNGSVSILNGTTPILSGTDEFFGLSGNDVLAYDLNSRELVGRQLVFGVQLSQHARNQDLLWHIAGPNATYEAFLQPGSFVLGYQMGASNWVYESAAMDVPRNQWFLAGFEVSSSGDFLSGFVNGEWLTEPFSLSSHPTLRVNVGKYDSSIASDYVYSISGNVTNLYSLPANNSHDVRIGYVWSSLTGTLRTFPFSDPLSITLSGTDATASLTVGGMVVPVGPIPELWIGKLTDFPSLVSIVFNEVRLSSVSSGPNLELVTLDFVLFLPAVISVWCLYPRLSKKLEHLWAASR